MVTRSKPILAALRQPSTRRSQAGKSEDEAHCTLCDCSNFQRSKVATICTCGHHYEDHEAPEPGRRTAF